MLELLPWLMVVLSSFCSYGFFLLGFLSEKPKEITLHIRYCLKRYYRPLLLFYTLSSVLYFIIYRHAVAHDSILSYFVGLAIQSADTLKKASGFSLFWFIPCYVLLTSLRSIAALNRYIYFIILAVAFAFHFGVAYYLSGIWTIFPFSFHVALYCYPICLIFARFRSFLISNRYVHYAGSVLFILCCMYIALTRSSLYFSANIFPRHGDIAGILIHDVCAISALSAFSHLYSLFRSRLIIEIGKYSFEFYLIHQFANYLVINAFGKIGGYASILHLCAVIAITMCSIWLLKTAKIYQYIFPNKK